MEEEYDEEFGDDVLPTAAPAARPEATAIVVDEEEEEDDEPLYGTVTVTDAAAGGAEASTAQDDGDDDEDDEEEDEGIAIVLKETEESPSKSSKLRFVRGGNQYVRDEHPLSTPPLQPRNPGDQYEPTFEELSLLGIGGRRTAFDVDIDQLEEKPWRKPGVDISDYFNYGFDEASWRDYCAKQLQKRRELAYQKTQEKEAEEKEKAAAALKAASAMSDPGFRMMGGPRGPMYPPRGPPPPWHQPPPWHMRAPPTHPGTSSDDRKDGFKSGSSARNEKSSRSDSRVGRDRATVTATTTSVGTMTSLAQQPSVEIAVAVP
ncbi:hypothetical protein SPRG_14839 [Saprolegnia parasitica CBS 223.65]|uniref:Pre-mRNA polyadenylation factor Fip1 domain-containing protein n=1 Tax=Saprolegnia parasitica (strain CBS 223.65) TaxID=695850 RepID=A0A067C040_SAPPC|nr:hypothetical protein SPRG_14839 [Saprolegnia parasitica CBS 223.65]KDO19931.1 hypothetical protein SPRG_14839 [Saprolegnia parasitica CBS 223.65]|eukprot:XP_012209370.1 hypothetical protein SPRG_14839 [Saprolegnia parasitica CBS 223.65]